MIELRTFERNKKKSKGKGKGEGEKKRGLGEGGRNNELTGTLNTTRLKLTCSCLLVPCFALRFLAGFARMGPPACPGCPWGKNVSELVSPAVRPVVPGPGHKVELGSRRLPMVALLPALPPAPWATPPPAPPLISLQSTSNQRPINIQSTSNQHPNQHDVGSFVSLGKGNISAHARQFI